MNVYDGINVAAVHESVVAMYIFIYISSFKIRYILMICLFCNIHFELQNVDYIWVFIT